MYNPCKLKHCGKYSVCTPNEEGNAAECICMDDYVKDPDDQWHGSCISQLELADRTLDKMSQGPRALAIRICDAF